jgi:hypothetical protein
MLPDTGVTYLPGCSPRLAITFFVIFPRLEKAFVNLRDVKRSSDFLGQLNLVLPVSAVKRVGETEQRTTGPRRFPLGGLDSSPSFGFVRFFRLGTVSVHGASNSPSANPVAFTRPSQGSSFFVSASRHTE